jgi:pimeloyl-ACP methyl ester carboxylesterase
VHARFIDVEGVRTRYFDEGDGPTIVLLHGAALAVDCYNTWFRVLNALRDEYRIVTFDQVGFGETEMPADGVYKSRLERVAHATAFLDALNIERAALIGHSEGAFMASRIAITRPILASHLAIVTSGGTAPYLGGDRDADWIKVAEANYNDPAQFENEDNFIRIARGLCFREHADYEALLRQGFHRAQASGHAKLMENMPKADTDYLERERLQRDHVLPYLRDLDIPVLLIWALNDEGVVMERAFKLLEHIPKGELHVFSNAAHNVMHDRTDAFNKLLRGWCRPAPDTNNKETS